MLHVSAVVTILRHLNTRHLNLPHNVPKNLRPNSIVSVQPHPKPHFSSYRFQYFPSKYAKSFQIFFTSNFRTKLLYWFDKSHSRTMSFCRIITKVLKINTIQDQLDVTITIYWYSNQLIVFRAIFLPILRSAILCFTACGIMHPSCCRPVAWNAEALTMCSVWRMFHQHIIVDHHNRSVTLFKTVK